MLNRWFLHAKGGVNAGFFITDESDVVLTQEGSLLAEDGKILTDENVTPIELTIEGIQLLT